MSCDGDFTSGVLRLRNANDLMEADAVRQSPTGRRHLRVEPSLTAVSLKACLVVAASGRTRATPRGHNGKSSGVMEARPETKGGRGRSRVGRYEHALSHDVAIVAARLTESMTESRFPTHRHGVGRPGRSRVSPERRRLKNRNAIGVV